MTPDIQTPAILDSEGRAARRPVDHTCPQCGAGPDRRVPSGGFGVVHDVCSRCAYEFSESTR